MNRDYYKTNIIYTKWDNIIAIILNWNVIKYDSWWIYSSPMRLVDMGVDYWMYYAQINDTPGCVNMTDVIINSYLCICTNQYQTHRQMNDGVSKTIWAHLVDLIIAPLRCVKTLAVTRLYEASSSRSRTTQNGSHNFPHWASRTVAMAGRSSNRREHHLLWITHCGRSNWLRCAVFVANVEHSVDLRSPATPQLKQ